MVKYTVTISDYYIQSIQERFKFWVFHAIDTVNTKSYH